MRIIEVVPTLEQEASGPSYSVPRLARALAELGHDVHLMSAGGQAVVVDPPLRHTRYARDWGEIPGIKLLELSSGLLDGLHKHAAETDLIHAHGLWTGPTVYPGWAARRAGVPLIVSPRGTLSPVALRRSRWRKMLFWRFAQRSVLNQARLLHATSEDEYHDIRAMGLKQPVAVIPNGIDLPTAPPATNGAGKNAHRRLLYLGRLHPIKGLEMLLTAWADLLPHFPDWELRLVGPSEEGYKTKLLSLSDKLNLKRITFAGPCYGSAKRDAFEAADLYVLPSFSENFGMSVAEALAHGTPVVTTTGTPWPGLAVEGCGWWVAPDKVELGKALGQAMTMKSGELAAMGGRGRAWMKRDFSWDGVGRKMAAAYRWVLAGGDAPEFVRLS